MAGKLLLPGPTKGYDQLDVDAEQLLWVHASVGLHNAVSVLPFPIAELSNKPTFSQNIEEWARVKLNRPKELRVSKRKKPRTGQAMLPRAVVVFEKETLTLANIFALYTPPGTEVVMLFRAIGKDLSPWRNRLNRQKSRFNSGYPDFIDDLMETINPNPEQPPIGRDMVMWMDERFVVRPKFNVPSARLTGHAITFHEYGPLLDAVLRRRKMNLAATSRASSPVAHAAPTDVEWRGDTIVYGGRAYRILVGEPDYGQLGTLFGFDCDIMFPIKSMTQVLPGTNRGRTLETRKGDQVPYTTAYIRISSKITGTKENPVYPDFAGIEKEITDRGSFVLASDTNPDITLEEAFQSFVPGAKFPKLIKPHSIPTPGIVLGFMGKQISKADDAGGDWAYSRMRFKQIAQNPLVTGFGEPGSGKTTWFEIMFGLQRGPRLVEYKYGYRPGVDEGTKWFFEFGGKAFAPGREDTLRIKLPPGVKLNAEGNLTDSKDPKVQAMILQWAEYDAKKHAQEAMQMLRKGHPYGTFRTSVSITSNWYDWWCMWHWATILAEWTKPGRIMNLVAIHDDTTGITKPVPSFQLGQLPVEVSNSTRNGIRDSFATMRANGIFGGLTAHSVEGFMKTFPDGALFETNMAIFFPNDGHQYLHWAIPSDEKFQATLEFPYVASANLGDLPSDWGFGNPTPVDR